MQRPSHQTFTSDLSVHASGPVIAFEARQRNYQKLSEEWNEVVEKIRNVDGFQDFLKPSRYQALRKAAAEGPVVLINVSKRRSDAIIISATAEPILVPLPNISPEDLETLSSQFQSARLLRSERKLLDVLKELWEMVVQPVA
jgi:hypothetical protein